MEIGSLQQGAVGLIAVAIITAITRIIMVYLSLRGAPPETRSSILDSLAGVFRSFGFGRLQHTLRFDRKKNEPEAPTPPPSSDGNSG